MKKQRSVDCSVSPLLLEVAASRAHMRSRPASHVRVLPDCAPDVMCEGSSFTHVDTHLRLPSAFYHVCVCPTAGPWAPFMFCGVTCQLARTPGRVPWAQGSRVLQKWGWRVVGLAHLIFTGCGSRGPRVRVPGREPHGPPWSPCGPTGTSMSLSQPGASLLCP